MILVFGTICLDRVRRVPFMPPPGGYVEVTSEQLMLGGEAANTANALKAWGAPFTLAGNGIGDGINGDLLRRELSAHGLKPFEGQVLPGSRAPVCDVFVEDSGERTMIGLGFSEMKNTIDPSRLPFQAGEWFTAEPNMGEAARQAVSLAHEAGMRTYTMDFVERDDPVFPGAVWQSSTDWAGERSNVHANLAVVSKLVSEKGCTAVLTDGERGLVAGSPDLEPKFFPAYSVESFVDSTGAGDIFRAGMLYGLDQGWPIKRCLRFASAAGCLACRTLGATTVVPTLTEIEGLISGHADVSNAY